MPYKNSHHRGFALDYWVILALAILVVIGITMSFSVGFYKAVDQGVDPWKALVITRNYVIRLIPGFLLFLAAILFPVRWYRRVALPFLILIVVLLIAVVLRGQVSHGASRWLGIGPLRFQPSEFAKLALVWFIAWYASARGQWFHLFGRGLLPVLIGVGLLIGLVVLQPDVSTAGLLGVVALGMLFLAGVPLRHFFALGAAGLALTLLVAGSLRFLPPQMAGKITGKFQYVGKRVHLFLHPEDHTNLQYVSLGLSEGGILGTGIGRGKIKFAHLTEPDTDFVYAVIGEEMGLLGMWIVLGLYLLLGWRAFSVAQRLQARHKDPMFYLTAAGIGLILLVFPLAHMGVVLGVLPPTGQPLPFISRGGSNLWLHMVLLGFLLRLHHLAQTGWEVLR